MGDGGSGVLVVFVDTYVSSFEAWDVLAYFAAHPAESVTLSTLAHDIGRRQDDLVAAAERLADQGALEREGTQSWRLCDDSAFRNELDVFSDAVRDQKDRLLVLTRLLENLAR